MTTVDIHEAQADLPRLVDAVASGATPEIVIARNGRPAARLVPVPPLGKGPRIGAAKGVFRVPDTIDADNAAVTAAFTGRPGPSDDDGRR